MKDATDEIILEFPVMFSGWECDDRAWVMERPDGVRYLKTTNHGSPCVVDEKFFNGKLMEYEHAIWQTEKALELVREHKENKT